MRKLNKLDKIQQNSRGKNKNGKTRWVSQEIANLDDQYRQIVKHRQDEWDKELYEIKWG